MLVPDLEVPRPPQHASSMVLVSYRKLMTSHHLNRILPAKPIAKPIA
jgi:hypothetical protein